MAMKKHLSKKEIKNLSDDLLKFGDELSKKDSVELVKDDKYSFILVNSVTRYFYYDGQLVPFLKNFSPQRLRDVKVDKGAIKFVVGGADIMRPGIVEVDKDIKQGEVVRVVEEIHGKGIALGIALVSGKEMEKSESGKMVKNIHYVGDNIWKSG